MWIQILRRKILHVSVYEFLIIALLITNKHFQNLSIQNLHEHYYVKYYMLYTKHYNKHKLIKYINYCSHSAYVKHVFL